MKQIKRIILPLLFISLLICAFTACTQNSVGGAVGGVIGEEAKGFNEIYENKISMPFQTGYTSSTKVTVPESATSVGGNFCFMKYMDTSTEEYCVYNVELNRVVLKISAEKIAKADDVSLYNGYVKIIETNADTKAKTTTVYNKNGKTVSKTDGEAELVVIDKGIIFNEKFYYFKDGELKKEYTVPPFINITENYKFTDNYVVTIEGRRASYYNEKFEAVAVYEVPGHAADYDLYLLDDGKLFVQYTLLCDYTASNYDYMDQQKYTVHNVIFDPAEKQSVEKDLGVYVTQVYNKETKSPGKIAFEDIFTDEVKNVIEYYIFVDGVIDDSTAHYVLMENDGKIGATLDNYVEGQRGLVTPLNNEYYYVPTVSGYALLKSNGDLAHTTLALGNTKEYGYWFNYKIYNNNFELVMDLNKSEYSLVSSSMDSVVLYSKNIDGEIHFYRYDKNGEAEITPPEGRVIAKYSPLSYNKNYYVIEHYSEDDKSQYSYDAHYSYYSFSGELLFTTDAASSFDSSMTVIAECEDAMLVRYKDVTTSEYVYLRLAKSK